MKLMLREIFANKKETSAKIKKKNESWNGRFLVVQFNSGIQREKYSKNMAAW